MYEYLNIIQLISGIAAAALVFIGIFISVKKLNPEKYETIPVKSTVISIALIALGLLSYAVTKTCTNLTVETAEHYELGTIYFASVGEVVKSFGFVLLVPILFRLFKPRTAKKETAGQDLSEELEEN